jgi:hypothetical protein
MTDTFRTFNYTGRSRIKKDSIRIDLEKEEEELISGLEIQLDTDKVESTHKEAQVILEGRYLTEYERFELGKVSDLDSYYELEFENPIYAESLIFRLIVVGLDGRILAQADKIRPKKEETQDILKVDLLDLGRKAVWEVQYRGRRGAPVLVLNSSIPGIKNALKKDSDFRLSILPNALRDILFQLSFVEDIEDPDDASVEWHQEWLTFSEEVLNVEPPESLDYDGSNNRREELETWINDNIATLGSTLSSEWRKTTRGWGQ